MRLKIIKIIATVMTTVKFMYKYITMYYTVFLLRSKLMNNIGKIMVTLQIKTPNPHPIQIKNILVGGGGKTLTFD